jgi:hypothetical protein
MQLGNTETNRIHLILFGNQNRPLGPHLAALHRILVGQSKLPYRIVTLPIEGCLSGTLSSFPFPEFYVRLSDRTTDIRAYGQIDIQTDRQTDKSKPYKL